MLLLCFFRFSLTGERLRTKISTQGTAIGHFRVLFSLYFKASLCAKFLLSVFIHIDIRTNYRNKNFAFRLALKEKLRGTQKLISSFLRNCGAASVGE